MTDEVNEFYEGLYIDLEIVVKGLSFFIDSPEAHMCYVACLFRAAFFDFDPQLISLLDLFVRWEFNRVFWIFMFFA